MNPARSDCRVHANGETLNPFAPGKTMDITSANATAVLTVDKLYPAGIELQMFGTDQAISQDSLEIAQTRMGVDGRMVAGVTPNIVPITITLEAASPSFAALSNLWAKIESEKRIFQCTLVCTVPAVSQIFTWTRGMLVSGVPFPNLEKVLAATSWVFHFERLKRSSY